MPSHSRASASKRRAIACSPPAVFSTRIGSGACIRSKVFTQFSTPTSGPSPLLTWPPCTISPRAPIEAATVAWSSRILRDGMRILLLVEATLTMYGACT